MFSRTCKQMLSVHDEMPKLTSWDEDRQIDGHTYRQTPFHLNTNAIACKRQNRTLRILGASVRVFSKDFHKILFSNLRRFITKYYITTLLGEHT